LCNLQKSSIGILNRIMPRKAGGARPRHERSPYPQDNGGRLEGIEGDNRPLEVVRGRARVLNEALRDRIREGGLVGLHSLKGLWNAGGKLSGCAC
jgi:hypothetical protein